MFGKSLKKFDIVAVPHETMPDVAEIQFVYEDRDGVRIVFGSLTIHRDEMNHAGRTLMSLGENFQQYLAGNDAICFPFRVGRHSTKRICMNCAYFRAKEPWEAGILLAGVGDCNLEGTENATTVGRDTCPGWKERE